MRTSTRTSMPYCWRSAACATWCLAMDCCCWARIVRTRPVWPSTRSAPWRRSAPRTTPTGRRPTADRRIWGTFAPRSASSGRRVFQDDFARSFGAADEVVVAAVFRSSLPESERLSAEQLVDDLRARKQHARYIPGVDYIVRTVVDEHQRGDVVVLMSHG